jgi:hypothetical protein
MLSRLLTVLRLGGNGTLTVEPENGKPVVVRNLVKLEDSIQFADGTEQSTAAPDGVAAWQVKSADFAAAASGRYQVDTSGGAVTSTLPASASVGDEITIEDAKLSFATHNLTIARNGLKINGGTSDYTASVAGGKLSLVYISSGYGWSVK